MKQRLGHPATRAVAQEKRRDFSPALAVCGGGHIALKQCFAERHRRALVPGVASVKFHGSRAGSQPMETNNALPKHCADLG